MRDHQSEAATRGGRAKDPIDLIATRFRPVEPTLPNGSLDVRALLRQWDDSYNAGLSST